MTNNPGDLWFVQIFFNPVRDVRSFQHRNPNLAKVGVVSSNLIARSSFPAVHQTYVALLFAWPGGRGVLR